MCDEEQNEIQGGESSNGTGDIYRFSNADKLARFAGIAPIRFSSGGKGSLLRLQKEFQGRSYDLLVSHTTIVFSRYILLAWPHRQSTDQRPFGGLFYLLCDEAGTIYWAVALQQLVDSTPTMDGRFAQLHQGLSAYFKLRKLS